MHFTHHSQIFNIVSSMLEAVHKKSLFSVQRVTKILVSRAAVKLLFFTLFFLGVGKYCPFLEKKIVAKMKEKKKVMDSLRSGNAMVSLKSVNLFVGNLHFSGRNLGFH